MKDTTNALSDHWADKTAFRIVRQKGDRESYVCASGISPSGTVHLGNFREIISVDLVVRALKDLGKSVRFIYSWDDFDAFRKVPADTPSEASLESYLRRPIIHVPDPSGRDESFARANERSVEMVLGRLGINPEYIYQSERYTAGDYAEGMRVAMIRRGEIRGILDTFRKEPLPDSWTPITVFCGNCDHDSTSVDHFDGDWTISYHCENCDHAESVDLRRASGAKLLWRIDWPMRWRHESVDFEPAGKDHHSAGGSFDTAKEIVQQVYEARPPVTFKYDFISVKGLGGKMGSSLGNAVSIDDVLSVYQPEVVRYLFAGTRPDSEFTISFDLDVIKIYEDYDRCETAFYHPEEVGEKKRAKLRRIYQLSQVNEVEKSQPPQLPFRHLCNLLQIYEGDLVAARDAHLAESGLDPAALSPTTIDRLDTRVRCAWTWISHHAPEEFRFSLRSSDDPSVSMSDDERDLIRDVAERLREYRGEDETELTELFRSTADQHGVAVADMYKTIYRVLLNKERGPRLAPFVLVAGRERIHSILQSVV